MQDRTFWQLLFRRAVYLSIGILLTTLALVPLNLTAGRLPGPDVMYCLTMVYVIRRPEFVPIWSICLVFFLRDILSQAPLGLFTVLVLLGTELVRNNVQAFREYFFPLEWLWVASIFVSILLSQHFLLSLVLSETPKFLDQFYLFVFTSVAYPATVAAMRYGFGIHRPATGTVDERGHRI